MNSFSLPWGCAWKNCISKRPNATILCWVIVSFSTLILLSRQASLSVLYGNHQRFTLFKNDHTIQNGRWCPRRSPIAPYLLFRFLQRNEHCKLPSTENSSWKISCAAPLLEILLCSHWMEKSDTLWPRPHISDGLVRLMDSWFYPW